MQYQCRVIILHGLQSKDCRKDGVLVCRSSNKSFQPTETGIEMIDTDHSQRTLYIHNHKRCWSFLSCRNPKRVHTNQSFFKTIKLSWIGKSLGIRWFLGRVTGNCERCQLLRILTEFPGFFSITFHLRYATIVCLKTLSILCPQFLVPPLFAWYFQNH